MASQYEQLVENAARQLAAFYGYQIVTPCAGGFDLSSTDTTKRTLRVRSRERDLHANDAPPRIVFVPQGGEIVGPDRPGPIKSGGQWVKTIRVRKFTASVHCWGCDFEEAENMMLDAINALEEVAHNSVNFGAEVWEASQPGQGGIQTLGEQISFTATFDLLVTTPPGNTAHVTHFRATVTTLDSTVEIDK